MHTHAKCPYGILANAPLKYQVLFNILESKVKWNMPIRGTMLAVAVSIYTET